MKTFVRFTLVVLIVLLAFNVGMAQDDDTKILRGMLSYDELPGIDPALAEDAPSIQILNMTTIGLTVIASEDNATLPGLAESWDITENEDGTATYTFNMLQEIPWVQYDAEAGEVVQVTDADGNVRYVTANDVVYGIIRTLMPETAGPYAYVLAPRIVGAEAFNAGEGAAEDVMVQAVDDYTLEIVAPFAAGPNAQIYGMWMARPQPQWAIEEYAELWQEAENNQAYGPYIVKEWIHGDSITLIENSFWPGTESVPNPAIDEIYLVFREESTAMAMFEAGELDYLSDVPGADLDRIRADAELAPQLSLTAGACSYYYGLNVEQPPLDNVNLRLAMSYAVDREAIVDNVTRAGETPAQWFTLPGMTASPTLESHPDLGIWYDPDLAQEYLQAYLDEAGLESAADIPTISLVFNTSETHAAIAQAVQQMWAEELGIEIQLTNQEFQVYLDSRRDFNVYRAGWCFDFTDTDNFLTEFTTAADADNHWSNPVFDELILEARSLTDIDARREIYAQAEEILVLEEAAIIPFYWYVKDNMTAPYVERTYASDNAETFWEWDINR